VATEKKKLNNIMRTKLSFYCLLAIIIDKAYWRVGLVINGKDEIETSKLSELFLFQLWYE
jgi:hypothetical protein